VVGESTGERRRRDRGGAPAVTRTPARLEVVKLNARPGKIEGGLGKVKEGLVGGEREWSSELTGGGGKARRTGAAVRGRRGGGREHDGLL
jgi:hypothetical protein